MCALVLCLAGVRERRACMCMGLGIPCGRMCGRMCTALAGCGCRWDSVRVCVCVCVCVSKRVLCMGIGFRLTFADAGIGVQRVQDIALVDI